MRSIWSRLDFDGTEDFRRFCYGKAPSSPPPAPDPSAVAQAQGAANREAAIASGEINRVNQITPYGNLTYQQTGTSSNNNPLGKLS